MATLTLSLTQTLTLTHLVAALPEAPLDLYRRNGRDGVRAPDLVGGALAEAHILHLALVDQLLRTWHGTN